ncbi:MAG: NAD(P)-dependent alcohol dehydrogenase [Chloroflexi bacterium]|nr:NAD(P)-dependent alcohol dehydrogenase [Chloroflexota bacterium]
MKAAVHDRYGPPEVLRIEDVPEPVAGPGEVLVRVHRSTVNRTDCGFRAAEPVIVRPFSGIRRPRRRVLGNEFAGVVEAIGPGVTRFAVGDRVFGVDQDRFGASAELMVTRETAPIATMPDDMSFDDAAAMSDGFILAHTCLTGGTGGAGTRVLVYGATGSIGTAAVQLAHAWGAHVTAVADASTLDLVRSLGAEEVIDRRAQDFTRLGRQWDVVFDAVGKLSFAHCRRAVVKGGPYVTTDLGRFWHVPPLVILTAITGRLGTRRTLLPLPTYRQSHVEELRQLWVEGRYRAVIDRHFPLADIVEATRYVQAGQKVGNIVIDVTD